MNPISPEALLEAQNWRYAVKKFDPNRKIPTGTWDALEKSLVLTPSSFGLQPWKFLVIQDRTILEQLVAHSWGQKQVTECSHFVVFLVLNKMTEEYIDRFVADIAVSRGTTPETLAGYRNVMVDFLVKGPATPRVTEWARDQVYIALGNFMTSAALIGVDTCPMEGLLPHKYDEVLGLTGGLYSTAVACPAGYRSSEDKYAAVPKFRFPASQMVERR